MVLWALPNDQICCRTSLAILLGTLTQLIYCNAPLASDVVVMTHAHTASENGGYFS